MRVLIVSEGRHELGRRCEDGALPILIRRLLGANYEPACEKVSSPKVRVHLHPGKTGRLTKRALGWIRYAEREGFHALVLVVDEDGDKRRRPQLDKAQYNEHLRFPRALGVAIRTFDAWMLADEEALSRVLSHKVSRQPDPEGIPEPKAVCRSLRDESTRDLSLTAMYTAVAAAVEIAILERRCPTAFGPFATRVRRALAST